MESLEVPYSHSVVTKVEPLPAPPTGTGLGLEDLFEILQVDPHDSLMALDLGKRLYKAGRYEEALKLMRSVLLIDNGFPTLYFLGMAEYQMDLLNDSFKHLEAALLVAPGDNADLFEIFKTLGNIFVRWGDFDSAEDSYNKAHRLNPDADILWVNFGTLFIQRADWDGAADKFRRAVELNSANDKAWVGLALCHRLKGDSELAWGNMEAALEYNPLNEVALGLALEWSAQEGSEFRALELIRNFLVAGGWSEKMSLAFAWLSWRRGDRKIARLELERLLAVNPANMNGLSLIQEMRAAV